ncbi:MAG: helix-turn-helix domain-containing protein [Chloroflexi bacterium]|nr:helix-turn-helix domain-containing protein [Chloroflexota bacterium]
MDAQASRSFIQSLAKGLEVLRCFGPDSPTLSLTELAARMGWNKTTAFRFASTLRQLGYLEQDHHTRRYRLGVKVLELGFGCLSSMSLPERAQPYLEELFHQTGQPTQMAVLDGPDIVYLARVADRRLTAITPYVGCRLPAYCTSMGKVLLAHRPWEEVQRLMAGVVLQPHTPHTITTPDGLRRALEQIRQAGYGVTHQELELGVRSAAAPIRDASAQVIAALNLSTSVARVDLDTLLTCLLPQLLQAAERLSAALGYRRSPGPEPG